MSLLLRRFIVIYERLLPNSSLKSRLTHGAFWTMVSMIAAQGSSLLTSIVLARILGMENFGKVGILISTLGTLGTFAGVGLGATSTKYISVYRNTDPEKAGRVIGLIQVVGLAIAFLVSTILFVFAVPLARNILNSVDLSAYLRISCAVLFFNTITGIQLGALFGFEDFKTIAILNITINGIFSFIITYLGAKFGGLGGTVLAMVIIAAGMAVGSRMYLTRKYKLCGIHIDYSKIWHEIPILGNFSIPSFLSGIVVSPAVWFGSVLLVNQTNGYAEMGIFNAANQWRSAILFIPGIITQVATPVLSNLLGEKRIKEYKRVVLASLLTTTFVTTGVALLICGFSKKIMSFYGMGFSDLNIVLILVVLTTVLSALGSAVGPILISLGRLWQGFLINTIWAINFIILSLAWSHKGAVGLATAYLLSYGIHILVLALYFFLSFHLRKGRTETDARSLISVRKDGDPVQPSVNIMTSHDPGKLSGRSTVGNIMIVTNFPFPMGGGMMSHIELLKKGLEESGYQCVILSGSQINQLVKTIFIRIPTKLISWISRDSAIIYNNESTSFFLALLVLIRLLFTQPTIINPQSVYCTPWVLRIAGWFNIRVILTVHGYATFEPISQGYVFPGSRAARYYENIETRAYQKTDHIITVDSRIRNHILGHDVPVWRVTRIKNFLDTGIFHSDSTKENAQRARRACFDIEGEDTFICLCPRRWVPKNGVEYAVRAWKIALEKLPNRKSFLGLVGFGQEENNLHHLVMELGLTDSVIFKKGIPHASMPGYFIASDLILIPSIHIADVEEATSIAALEAMASGKPTIVTNVGGLRELIIDGTTGLVVPERDPQALGDAIVKIYQEPDLRSQLGSRARDYVVANHGYMKATRDILEVYNPDA